MRADLGPTTACEVSQPELEPLLAIYAGAGGKGALTCVGFPAVVGSRADAREKYLSDSRLPHLGAAGPIRSVGPVVTEVGGGWKVSGSCSPRATASWWRSCARMTASGGVLAGANMEEKRLAAGSGEAAGGKGVDESGSLSRPKWGGEADVGFRLRRKEGSHSSSSWALWLTSGVCAPSPRALEVSSLGNLVLMSATLTSSRAAAAVGAGKAGDWAGAAAAPAPAACRSRFAATAACRSGV